MIFRRNTSRNRTPSDQSGFTLIELLVGIAIFTTVAALATSVTFQILGVQRKWREDIIAVKEVRAIESAFAGDALNMATSTLVDGAATSTSILMAWTDVGGNFHSAAYNLSGSSTPFLLIRSFDGSAKQLGRRVNSIGFRRVGDNLHLAVVAQASATSTRSSNLVTFLRNAQ